MSDLYWITRLDGIVNLSGTLLTVSGVITCIFALVLFGMFANALIECEDYHEYKLFKAMRLNTIIGCVASVLFAAATVFIPSTKEACMIYLGGTVLEYVQGNEQIQELPDKVVNLATSYLDELISKDNSKSKKDD
jgi:hypothetical protein